ncbi:MAG: GxxExxY protein [bacterium]
MSTNENYKYKALTHNIIGCAMEVHNELATGFLEPVYEEALSRELTNENIHHDCQTELEILYKGESLNKKYRADIIVENKVLLELKAISNLSEIEDAQMIHYLKVTNIDVGLLINFAQESLQWKRFIDD